MMLLICLGALAPAPAAGQGAEAIQIHLRRASFDPLARLPGLPAPLRAQADSRLLLVQLRQPVDAAATARLTSLGLAPLAYVPDNTFVVRADAVAPTAPWLRWVGRYEPAYKLPASMDRLLQVPGETSVDLRLLTARDADMDALAGAVQAAGGTLVSRSDGLTGNVLRMRLPARVLPQLLARDDVLWVEPFIPLRLHNNEARGILRVPEVQQQLGLTGAGQIVAITDTGLDVQTNLSADFAGRVIQGFSRQEMRADCAFFPEGQNWSDLNGHGTHVAGSLLGSGALSPPGVSFAGIAPQAQIVVQAVSSGGSTLNCLPDDARYLDLAYAAGARIQNTSFGGPTGYSGEDAYGAYSILAQQIDSFLWQHQDHLVIASAGNSGSDVENGPDGVVDYDSIEQPAIAKNLLSVGATENNRPPIVPTCSTTVPEQVCWGAYFFQQPPLVGDFVSDAVNGMAAFSARGPTDDGRIKPEIVAPGTNVISSRSHHPAAFYPQPYNDDYAYDSGTSMAAPMVSGLATLARQWLGSAKGMATPSAALLKALLLNGAANISPGQYGTGPAREIPASWPNNVEGWGRADLAASVGFGGAQQIWLADNRVGLQTGQTSNYTVVVGAGQPLRITLAWTDYPASPMAQKVLVNDLDLEVQAPDGLLLGNATAELTAACRSAEGADRCNNIESVEIAAPLAGTYIVRVRAPVMAQGAAQPFALAARAAQIGDAPPLPAPTLQAYETSPGPALTFFWNSTPGASFYQLEQRMITTSATDGTLQALYDVKGQSISIVEDVGTYEFRVRGCNPRMCGDWSAPLRLSVTVPPKKLYLPWMIRG